jgi:large subunit ribosomal protein L10
VPTPKKVEEVKEITELLTNSQLAILTDYRGLTVADLQNLRRQLRPHQANIRVVKNTLASIAADQAGMGGLKTLLEGPTALVTAGEDVVAPAKVINDFVRTSRILQVKGALLEGQVIAAGEIENLANLPPREVLLGRVVGGIQSPLYGLVGVLAGTIRQLGYVLNARAEQLGGNADAA